jgi:hypothetical protein|tara:strand:+ start:295 stop:504 length:210 start_codon:yes stop_codon:yes gene_type:complete
MALKGNQKVLDKNNNNKIDAEDFKLLRKKDGGLVEATNKLKAQGLKGGGKPRGTARGMGAAKRGGGYNI